MEVITMNKKELENFFNYVLDKVEDCYKKEVEQAMKDFIKDNTK